MKFFWIIFGLLIVCGVGFLVVVPVASGDRPTPAITPPIPDAVAPTIAPTTEPDQPTPSVAAIEPATPRNATSLPPLDYPHPDSITDAIISGDWSEVSPAKPAPHATPPAAPISTTTQPDRGYAIAKSTITKRDDGSLLIDDRLIIKGDGSEGKPYEITWDLLTSAEKTYDPRNAKKKIPEAVAMLDGKHVRIKANVAFPLYVQQPREVLAMLNQWDGCCIGVPPTPYDAIEVRLAKPVTGNDRFASSGVVEGTFAVKPYVTGNWLVGLYVIDGAVLKPDGFSSAPTTHGQ